LEWFFGAVVGYTLILLVIGLALTIFGLPGIFLTADREDRNQEE
jgi:hypothetical protein